jgi:hypothetical protein
MPRNKAETVIFLHIPKAAGTTLLQVIHNQYPPKDCFEFGSDAISSVDAFKAMSAKKKQQIKMLSGHMGFGLHQFMPQSTTYITILREPVARVVSYYYHVLDNPTHYLYELVTKENLDLEAFSNSQLTAEIDNGQTRLLAGPEFMWTIPYGQCTSDLLEMAKQNLKKHFSVVGTADQFDKTLILLKLILGWKNLSYTRANVNERHPEKKQIPSQASVNIQRDNQLDIQLYEFAQQLLTEEINQCGLRFTFEYAKFRATDKKRT